MMWAHEGRYKDLPESVRAELREYARARTSPLVWALLALVACPLLALAGEMASLASLLVWPIAPVWVFVVMRRAARREDQAIVADIAYHDRVWVAAVPGEPGCSVIAELRESMDAERSRGMVVEAVPRPEGRRRMLQYLEWINQQRRERGKEPL